MKTDTMDRMDEVRSFIKDNIDYDVLLQCHPTEKMDINELVELMVETIAVKQPVIVSINMISHMMLFGADWRR